MSWNYTDDSVSEYYRWYRQNKELEKMRKIKAKQEEKRKKQLERERIRLENKLAREQAKEEAREAKKQKKIETMEILKEYGYKKGYTKKNPFKGRKNKRDIKLCQELYQKNKDGISRFKLAVEYGMTPITVNRYIYEYEFYLNVKNASQEVKDLLQ